LAWDNAPPPSELPRLISSDDPNFVLGDTFATNPYIVFNMISPNEGSALAKLEVRQALSHALNRDNLIQVRGGPEISPPLTHVLPEGITGSEDFDLYPHDPEKAQDLLAAAGYPDGLTLKFLYRNETEASRKMFETVQQDLSAIGVDVEGVPSPNADFYTEYLQVPEVAERGVWDMSLSGWGPDWYGDAALSFFNPLFSGEPSFPPIGSNFAFYDNPAANDLIGQAATSVDADEAADLWAQADRLVMEDAPIYPITSPIQANYHAEHVNNAIYIPAFQRFDPANVWIDPDKQD
jgi:peptide/nickel transport system substrate-binding protein